MWEWINENILKFEKCFSRKAAFRWFVVIIIGLMLRTDHLGITSIIRELGIAPKFYETMLHFFRAQSWNLTDINRKWMQVVKKSGVLFHEESMPILVGDGVKQSKEARKMPCVKRLFQESENSSKPSYIFGHMFGAIGVLIGTTEKLFCVPISVTIQDGNKCISRWLKSSLSEESHVTTIIREACCAAAAFTPSILLLDRYFLTVPALITWLKEEQTFGDSLLTIVTKAKINAVAYENPVRKAGRGRPPVKGACVKLRDLFTDMSVFTEASVNMYGKMQTVQFLCKDFLWGKGLYHKLRFVMVTYGSVQSILVCTNTDFSAEQIIRLYSYRFKIESCFRELKQVIAGFSYHFWCKAMPKLNRFIKSGEDTLDSLVDDKGKLLILSTFKAIEGFVLFSCIALGLLQICSLRFADEINRSPLRWLRTRSNRIPSEATTADFIRNSFFRMFRFSDHLSIVRLISSLQSESLDSQDSHIA